MENKKVSIPIYEGMELKMRVDSGFLVAEYSEEEEVKEEPGLKAGDLCIFWDKDKSKSIVGFLSRISFAGYYDTTGLAWMNAIKCDSIEHYKEVVK